MMIGRKTSNVLRSMTTKHLHYTRRNDEVFQSSVRLLLPTTTSRSAQRSSLSSILSGTNSSSGDHPVSLVSVAAASLGLLASLASLPSNDSTAADSAVSKPVPSKEEDEDEDGDESTTVVNWSGTHTVNVSNRHYHEPETAQEVEKIVAECHKNSTPLRPVGSALSPNGISFQPGGMISLANLDRIIDVDKENMTVTVEAGARVSQVIDELRKHHLTLPNLASIAEQQMGGFVQVGAHGTGALIPPVDDFVTSLKFVSPARGTVHLTQQDGPIFHVAKVALGCLGILTEVTIKCIPAHNLVEHTFVLTREEAKRQCDELLKKHKHVRYMWIPYEDAVVVVTNDPEDESTKSLLIKHEALKAKNAPLQTLQPLKDLLKQLSKEYDEPYDDENFDGKGFGDLRDALLAFGPLNAHHIKRVNKVEAEFWRNNQGYQMKPSDQLLQFDCGGQQWVFEVSFPTGMYDDNNGNDMKFMDNLLKKIESSNIPAPAPLEQRWSASSSSVMSPAHGPQGGLHCWVGVIMYLPSEDENQRRDITERFTEQYCDIVREIGNPLAVSHWAKLEMPSSQLKVLQLKQLMKSRYPLHTFNLARRYYDPKNILGNDLINVALGTPGSHGDVEPRRRQCTSYETI